MFPSTYLRAEGSLTSSCGSPGLLWLAVPSQWERRQTLGSGLVLPLLSLKAWLSSWQSSSAGLSGLLVWAQGLLPSHHSCLAHPCAGSGLYGQVRHPNTGRQLQVGKSPPAISLLSVPLLRTVLKHLLEGLEDISVTPVQLNMSSSSPSPGGDRWVIILVNLKCGPC